MKCKQNQYCFPSVLIQKRSKSIDIKWLLMTREKCIGQQGAMVVIKGVKLNPIEQGNLCLTLFFLIILSIVLILFMHINRHLPASRVYFRLRVGCSGGSNRRCGSHFLRNCRDFPSAPYTAMLVNWCSAIWRVFRWPV